MRHGWASSAGGLLAGCAVLALAWLVPGLLDGNSLANAMLKPAYKLPELIPAYVPGLRAGLQASLASGAGAALAAFAVWVGATRLARPTGPRQVGLSWRLALWLVLAVLAAVLSYLAIEDRILGRMEPVEEVTANRLAFVIGFAAAVLFWLLSLLGTERMMRPAVPLAPLLTARR